MLTGKFSKRVMCALTVALALGAATAHAQDVARIAAVNSDRILRESAPAKAAQTKLEAEFAKRDKDLQDMAMRYKAMEDKFVKDMPILSDVDRVKRQRELADMEKDVQRKRREYQEDINQRRTDELMAMNERITKVIRYIAEAEKYDIVLQDAVYFNSRIDITDKVLKALNK